MTQKPRVTAGTLPLVDCRPSIYATSKPNGVVSLPLAAYRPQSRERHRVRGSSTITTRSVAGTAVDGQGGVPTDLTRLLTS